MSKLTMLGSLLLLAAIINFAPLDVHEKQTADVRMEQLTHLADTRSEKLNVA